MAEPSPLALSLAALLSGGVARPATTKRARRAAHLLALLDKGKPSRRKKRPK